MTPKARGQDVSWYQDPAKMRYPEWAELYGMCFGFGRVALGTRRDQTGAPHRAAMRAAGYLTAPYVALTEEDSPIEQAKILIGERHPDDRLPDMLDCERGNLTERTIRAFCDYHDAHAGVELMPYIGFPSWTKYMRGLPLEVVRRYLRYECVMAAYPFDSPPGPDGVDRQPMDTASVARRSNPPAAGALVTPAPWDRAWSHQHTGHGTLKGYDGFLDLQVHTTLTAAELRARYAKAGSSSGGGVVPVAVPPVVIITPPPAPTWSAAEQAVIAGVAGRVRAAAEHLAGLGD